jgi:hypothetical protein
MFLLKEGAKAAARGFLQESQGHLAGVLSHGSFGGGQSSSEMRLGGWVSRAECALLFRLGPAHWLSDGQYLPQRKLVRFHINIIPRRWQERCSILLLGFQSSQSGN